MIDEELILALNRIAQSIEGIGKRMPKNISLNDLVIAHVIGGLYASGDETIDYQAIASTAKKMAKTLKTHL